MRILRYSPSERGAGRFAAGTRACLRFVGVLGLTLLALSAVVFLLTALPVDPARTLLGPSATPAQLALFNHLHGLDRPLLTRYLDWLGGVVHGNLGRDYVSGAPVWSLISPRLDRSLPLAALAWLLMIAVGVPLGLLTGLRAGRADRGITATALALAAVPEFVVGTLLLALLAVRFHWLPANSAAAGFTTDPFAAASAYVLPACTIALGGAVSTLRLTRANAREVAAEPYVRAATLRGLSPLRVSVRHVLPNAAPPIVGSLALRLAALIGGTVIAENVFGFPGLGALLVDSAQVGDTPVVQAIVLIVGAAFITVNLVADSLVRALTPRARTGVR